MHAFQRMCLALGTLMLVVLAAGLATHSAALWQPAAVVLALAAATGFGAVPTLRSYRFPAWIIAAVIAAMIYPQRILHVGSIDLQNPWLLTLAIQAVMFGMGTQMHLRDFIGVVRMPAAVLVGVFCQFTIMPLVGFSLAMTFDFSPEVAAGIVLVGSCSSGLASNVMVYMARGNLALSITLTTVATLLAPLVTPLWMKLLAGTMVEVSFFTMMLDIVRLVIVPVGAAMLADYLRHGSPIGRQIVFAAASIGTAWLSFLAWDGWQLVEAHASPAALPWLSTLGFAMGAVVAGAAYYVLTQWLPMANRCMPGVAMLGIIYVVAVITAAGRDQLLLVGGWLFLAAVIHNAAGYFLGYGLSRALGLDRRSARTVAFEVGLQNGGMASGLAAAMDKLATMGLAAALFASWMNVSGSILAVHWQRHPVDES